MGLWHEQEGQASSFHTLDAGEMQAFVLMATPKFAIHDFTRAMISKRHDFQAP
jgi:hypothetical protein